MRAVGHSSLVYLAWIAGGLLSLFGAMTYAELAARMPYAGGEYVYIRRAYGDLPAFLYMWTWFAVAKPASIATVTIGLARTLALFPSLKWLDHTAIAAPIPLAWSQLFAIAMTWLMTGLNYIGIRRAANFQLVFTWLKVLLVLVIAITCFASAHGLAANFGTIFTGAEGGFTGFMVALIAALWAYDGWNDLNMVAGEVRNPERNVPLALLFGVGIVGFLYISVNAAIQYMLPAVAVAASPRPAVAAVSVVLGATGATLVTAGMALSIFVTLNGTIMSGARVPFAAARDGLFFSRIAELSPRFGTPAPSLVLQASLSTLLLLAVGRFQQLFRAGDLRRVALLHDRDHHHLRPSPARNPGKRCDLPHVGLSRAPRALHRSGSGAARLQLPEQSAQFAPRIGHHRWRHSAVLSSSSGSRRRRFRHLPSCETQAQPGTRGHSSQGIPI